MAQQTVGFHIDKFAWRTKKSKSSKTPTTSLGRKFIKTLAPLSLWFQFFITWAGQIVEFFVVAQFGFDGNVQLGTREGSTYAGYVTMWSLFGVTATYLMLRAEPNGSQTINAEMAYSLFSTIAKLVIFITSVDEIVNQPRSGAGGIV